MTNDGTPKPVESYGTAFQTRLEDLVNKFTDYMECGEYHIHDATHEYEGITPLPHDLDEDKFKTALTEALRETIQACKPDTYLLGCARHWSDDPSLPCTCDENERTAQSTADRYETALLEALND